MPDDLSGHVPTESIETGSRRNTFRIRTTFDRRPPALLNRLDWERKVIGLGCAT